MITVGSLFSGIGGLELGLERAGMRVAWQVENNEYCQKVLAKHWPDVARFRDVRECGSHNLAAVDLICGGFPCQDISSAGQGVGLSGARSGLWVEFIRIVGELRPRYVLMENVSVLLNRGIGDILGTLAAFGYDAEWHCIPAAAVGAPHRRDRVFILAYAPRFGYEARAGQDRQPNRSRELPGGLVADRGGAVLADAHGQPLVRPPVTRTQRNSWDTEPAILRVLDGVPARLVEDRLKGLGNAVVPQVAEFIGRCIVEYGAANG